MSWASRRASHLAWRAKTTKATVNEGKLSITADGSWSHGKEPISKTAAIAILNQQKKASYA